MKLSLNVSVEGLTVFPLDHFWNMQIVRCLRISQVEKKKEKSPELYFNAIYALLMYF